MALQSSGAISLNEIHIEAGGTTGTLVSINDADIRALIGVDAATEMSFDDWYGAMSTTTVTVTQGSTSVAQATYYGYESGTPTGSVSPETAQGSSGNLMDIDAVYRIASSAGFLFYVDVSYTSDVDADEFTSFSFTANGNDITLLTSEASTTTLSGGLGRRWLWSSSTGLDATTISDITAEWDGTGDIEVTFTP